MKDTNTGTVSFTLDPDNPPRMAAEEHEYLSTLQDEEIDFSDMPKQTDMKKWRRPGLFGGPVGSLRQAALREGYLLVEPEIVEFFKADGDRSAERMNTVLREYVESHRKTA